MAVIGIKLSYPIQRFIMTANDCYRANRRIRPVGIIVHSTASKGCYFNSHCSNPWWKRWNKPGVAKCVHAFIDRWGIYQCLPWDWRGWHAGGTANSSYIGFEICEPGDRTQPDPAYFDEVYRKAVYLCTILCIQYGIRPVKPSLITHCEGRRLGIASNHADVMHWFPRYGKNMDIFRADVARQIALVQGAPEGEKPMEEKPSQVREHRVLAGQTLSSIGRVYGVPWRDIAALNHVAAPKYIIRTGQVLLIPGIFSNAPTTTYVVRRGDTLCGIAKALKLPGVTALTIAERNNIPAPYTIHAGEELLIA